MHIATHKLCNSAPRRLHVTVISSRGQSSATRFFYKNMVHTWLLYKISRPCSLRLAIFTTETYRNRQPTTEARGPYNEGKIIYIIIYIIYIINFNPFNSFYILLLLVSFIILTYINIDQKPSHNRIHVEIRIHQQALKSVGHLMITCISDGRKTVCPGTCSVWPKRSEMDRAQETANLRPRVLWCMTWAGSFFFPHVCIIKLNRTHDIYKMNPQ